MSQQTFANPNSFNNMSSSGLASRRGGQTIKPLSVEALRSPSNDVKENAVPTPRTSRGHLLAGLRTAPKSATVSSFAANAANNHAKTNPALYGLQEGGPKTALPDYGSTGTASQSFGSIMGYSQHQQQQQQQQSFTPDQILAPPEIHIEDQSEAQMDPDLYARLLQQNLQLAQQRQMLQHQLFNLTQAQQQLEIMNINGNSNVAYQAQALYQQQLLQQQQQLALAAQAAQQSAIYTYVDPATGQQAYYVDQAQLTNQYLEQAQQQQQQLNTSAYHQRQQPSPAPRLEVSPPRESPFRNSTPPRRNESPLIDNPAPLPPPSANAFRRGHKKSSSLMLALGNANLAAGQEPPKSAGPRTANFPVTPLTGGYGPGQARAGEHPVRQPRGPPSIEELKAKPTSKIEGSKNFAARTRRSAINNLKKLGFERRRVTTGSASSGSISPISETAEEAQSPLTDNESESGRSGSGSLNGEEVEPSVPSSRTSTGSWGAIGSDRPSSRQQKARKSAGSVSSSSGDEAASNGSFASVFKRNGRTSGRSSVGPDSPGQRKAPMMVLTNAEKRKSGIMLA